MTAANDMELWDEQHAWDLVEHRFPRPRKSSDMNDAADALRFFGAEGSGPDDHELRRKTLQRLGRLTPRVGDVYTKTEGPSTHLVRSTSPLLGTVGEQLGMAGPNSWNDLSPSSFYLVVPKGYWNPVMYDYDFTEDLADDGWLTFHSDPMFCQTFGGGACLLSFDVIDIPTYAYVGPCDYFNIRFDPLGYVTGFELKAECTNLVDAPGLEDVFPGWHDRFWNKTGW